MRRAVVIGHEGRVGAAFYRRLVRDQYIVGTGTDWFLWLNSVDPDILVFNCALDPQDLDKHLTDTIDLMSSAKWMKGLFVPSSDWIGSDSPYGRVKLVIEQAAAFYRSLGAKIVTDRIGYFPGDDAPPNLTDPFIDRLVTGDILYSRVMEKLL